MDLEETVNELAPRLLRYCRGRLRDGDAAGDVAQAALTALVERWRKHGPPDSPEAFVFGIASRRSGRIAWTRWRWPSTNGLPENADDPVAAIEAKSALDALRRDLEKLSHKERNALLLVAVAELSTSEAAAALGISDSAVKMRVSRARARLKELGHGN
jgi:RNA polymerase sigma-70 factor (ECF subfamily)